jgi:uncharacterized protein
MTSPLRAALRDRLKSAMRARDRQTAGVMRTVLAALENAEAAPVVAHGPTAATSEHVAGATVGVGTGEVPRRLLSQADEHELVAREIAELRVSATTLAEVGRHERSAELVRMAEAVEEILEG